VTQLARRWQAWLGDADAAAERAFAVISAATILGAAESAREVGFLTFEDEVVADRADLLTIAKQRALDLAAAYAPPDEADIAPAGEACRKRFRDAADRLGRAGLFLDGDIEACHALADLLCAGTTLSEQALMRREHDAFLTLAQRPETLTRMRQLRAIGAPVRPVARHRQVPAR
jgi:3-hydroxyacyl-CoA dehydrogenase